PELLLALRQRPVLGRQPLGERLLVRGVLLRERLLQRLIPCRERLLMRRVPRGERLLVRGVLTRQRFLVRRERVLELRRARREPLEIRLARCERLALLGLAALVFLEPRLERGDLFRLHGRGARRRGHLVEVALQLLDLLVALLQLLAQRRETVAVVARLGVELLGLRAPEVHFFLRQLVRAGLGDRQLFAQLADLRALGFGDLLELARGRAPLRGLRFERGEAMGEHVHLLFELRLRRTLALQLRVEIRCTGFGAAQRVLQQRERLFG